RMPRGGHVGGIERREVLAENLLGLVTLDAACALVPARDATFRVEHEDPVVLHAPNEHAKALLALAERLLPSLPRREVARHLGEADEPAARIAEWGDDDARPEARTILSDAPSLVPDLSLTLGREELGLGLSRCQIFGRVEDREVPADDLVGRVPLDALRPGVPAEDHARWIESEDRVVPH